MEIKRLEDSFEDLKLATLQSLQNTETEDENFLKRFQHRLILLSSSIKERHASFFSKKNRALIRRAKSVQVIFDLLSQYMNFLNCSLLFYVIDKFADPATKKEKDEFYSQLKSFRSRTRVMELQSVWKSHLPSDTVEVSAQCSHQSTMTLEQVEDAKEALACQASLESFTLLYCKAAPGSIVICWAIPTHLASLFARTVSDEFMTSLGIESVTINEYSLTDYRRLFPYEPENSERFGQIEPPLSISIKGILQRYPDGQIFKVFLL